MTQLNNNLPRVIIDQIDYADDAISHAIANLAYPSATIKSQLRILAELAFVEGGKQARAALAMAQR